ncbi:alpha/beta hydrolase [Spongiactinospora rosea]|uniref:Alpha/beta hydrolase n=1 Tax=Spongiactinospora rosea TaxID=2248750 RepID=A0A366LX72_9ACTN|nr:alpha/beta hydrolase [Spongiactinospora rosea]RBQ18133.1 alpha/beta hydrolase [Spongiactinospora rosea]
MTTVHTLETDGVQLHYEVRGDGPVLVLVGSPMAAVEFGSLAEAMAGEYTVVTHDPRGISGSVPADPDQDSTPELRAGDVVALLDAVGAETADVFGSSGGAVTGLALAARYPERVRTLVAHEAPVLELLPDADEQRAIVDGIVETYRREGVMAAWQAFMKAFGVGGDDDQGPPPPSEESPETLLENSRRFFLHEMRPTTRHVPDVAALRAGPVRVVVGVGAESRPLTTYDTSVALGARLGVEPVEFPGQHIGFVDRTKEFAGVLRRVLRERA